jgi:hypothetical protein
MLHELKNYINKSATKKEKVWRAIVYIFFGIMIFFFTAWFIRLMLKMREVGNFNFGGEEGFWKNTVPSLIDFSSGPVVSALPFLRVALAWLSAGLFIGAGIILIARLKKQKFTTLNWFTIFLFLTIFGCAAAIWLQHRLMNVPFSSDRAGLYFYVLFPLLLIICFFTLGIAARLRKIVAGILLVFPVISFFLTLNLDRTLLWPFNAHMKEAVQLIIDDSKTRIPPKGEVQVAISFLEYPVYNYYRYAAKANWLNFFVYGETGYNAKADYYLKQNEYDETPSPEFKVIWEKNNVKLFRREPFLTINELKTLGNSGYEEETEQHKKPGHSGQFSELINAAYMYGGGFRDTLKDTLRAGTIIWYNTFVYTDDIRSNAKWVVKAERGDEMVLGYAKYLSWHLEKNKAWNEVHLWYILQTDLLPGDRILLFFMNGDKKELYFDDSSAGYYFRSANP